MKVIEGNMIQYPAIPSIYIYTHKLYLQTTLRAPTGSFRGEELLQALPESSLCRGMFLAQGAKDLKHPQSVGTAATTSLASRASRATRMDLNMLEV